MKWILVFVCIIGFSHYSISQNISNQSAKKQHQIDVSSYAFITVENKGFGGKLKVEVDLGDSPEQIKAGKGYSEILTDKKSYAAILNHMAENGFELVESREISFSFQGTGGTSGIVFIMKSKN